MDGTKLGRVRVGAIAGLAALTLGVGLGGSGRLTYHEAFVAQPAREMVRAGGLALVPTVGGRPWLEKPPLSTWMAAAAGLVVGDVTEAAARLPSAVAAALLALGVAGLAARRFGRDVGLLAGAVQVTTAWVVLRGRLAEADVVLAALVVGVLVAFDQLRDDRPAPGWRWAFWALLGLTSLAKGVGFGAVLAGSVVGAVVLWDRDRAVGRRLADPVGWLVAAGIALAWPLAVAARHPEALGLWTLHVADRLAARPEHFIGGPWWTYGPAVLGQALPWTPLALAGAWGSLRRARHAEPGGADRLLVAWAAVPVLVLSFASVRNGHYALAALPPWSIWAALGLARVGGRLRDRRGWPAPAVRRAAVAGFAILGVGCGVGHAVAGPRLDPRGVEWGFYAAAGRSIPPGGPVAFLHDDWDRKPYPTPFGPVPHDWAVRLYYLDHPATWHDRPGDLAAGPGRPRLVVARDRDRPALLRLGPVETLARGPRTRFDREFVLLRVGGPGPAAVALDDAAGPHAR